MLVADIRPLYAYNDWANARVFAAVRALDPNIFTAPRGNSFSSIRDTVAHIAASEWVWLQRWNGHSPSAPPEWASSPEAAALQVRLSEVEAERAELLRRLSDAEIARALTYRNLRGEEFTQPLGEQLLHVVNHSTYHRGQVATLVRQAGLTPPGTDLIVYQRERPG